MKQYLLPEAGGFYKANLHSHSRYSDGNLTPSEMKALYKSHGYSVLAITDHELLLAHNDLTDDDFLMLTAYECAICDDDNPSPNTRGNCHLNFFARDPNNTKLLQFSHGCSTAYNRHGLVDVDRLEYHTLRERSDYCPETVQNFLRDAEKYGFLATYNHPTWSNEDKDFFNKFDGFFAMEIVNNASFGDALWPYNVHEYDQMLRAGKRVGCVATDDNHNHYPEGDPRCDSFGGFTMIKAPSLTYDNIITALERGDYYASTGPEIYEISYEDGVVYVKTSPAASVTLSTNGRRGRIAYGTPDKPLTEAALKIPSCDPTYFRITVNDGKGKFAFSRGYFTDELK